MQPLHLGKHLLQQMELGSVKAAIVAKIDTEVPRTLQASSKHAPSTL